MKREIMKKKALLVGGTGTISSAVTALLATSPDWELTVLNRGLRPVVLPEGVKVITADVGKDDVGRLIGGEMYDVVADFIAFEPEHVARDFRFFGKSTRQYIFVSSASAYAKPMASHVLTEETALGNPYWAYSQWKEACETLLHRLEREEGFPVTIVRPSHTYGDRSVPVAIHGSRGSWEVVRRMMAGKPVVVHGDGSSLWTLTHNTDFARAFVGLMGNAEALGETVQVTGDEQLTWNEIYQTIADSVGVAFKPCYVSSHTLSASRQYDLRGSLLGDKAATVVFDNARLKRLVPGFKSEVNFKEGCRRAVDNILRHEELQLADPEFDVWCDGVVALEGEMARRMARL